MSTVWDGTSSPLLASVYSTHNWLATTPAYGPFVPFSIFAIIHATRIACAYRGGARAGGFDDRLGLIQAAVVPCVLIFGGTTITGILMGIVPGWLISPMGLANYALVPLIVAKTPILSALLSIPHYPRELTFCLIDGFSRVVGITTFGVDTVLSHPNSALRNSPWAMVAVATLAGGGGGLIVPSFRGFHADWEFSTPPWIKNGPGIDVWGATVIGYIYATLIDAHPFFRILPSTLLGKAPFLQHFFHLPKTYLTAKESRPLLPAHEAKILCSIILASMLAIRILMPVIKSILAPGPKARKVKSVAAKNAVTSKKASVSLKEKKAQ